MMLILSDNVFRNLCTEYYHGKLAFSDLRLKILQALKEACIIRKYNEQKLWGINFHAIKPSKYWDSSTMAIDYVNLYKGISVIRKNGFEKSFIDSDMMIPWKYEDYLSNTQGHDFFSIFATVCSTKKGISQENISASARVVYSISDLQQTVLYKDLCNYSNAIRRKIIS